MLSEIFFIQREIPSLQPDIIGHLFNFRISSTTMTLLLVILVFVVLGDYALRRFALYPTKLQTVFEIFLEAVDTLITDLTNNKKEHIKNISFLIVGIFLFLIIANSIGLIPIISEIQKDGLQIFKGPTADFNTTLGLALGVIISIQLYSIHTKGLFGHIFQYIKIPHVIQSFKKGFMEGCLSIVDFFIGFLDIIGEGAKIISMSLRLFGNMFAGMVLSIVLLGASAYIIPSIWTAWSFFSAILQALVFSALAGANYMISVGSDEG